jgi:hypothetical protein
VALAEAKRRIDAAFKMLDNFIIISFKLMSFKNKALNVEYNPRKDIMNFLFERYRGRLLRY